MSLYEVVPTLVVDVRDTAGGVRVSVEGDVDMATANDLARELDAAIAAGEQIEIDLSGVTFMDSQGLRVLINAYNSAGDRKQLSVVAASQQVRRALSVTGLRPVLAPALDR